MSGLCEHRAGSEHRPALARVQRPRDRVRRRHASPPRRVRHTAELRENSRLGFRVARADSRRAIRLASARRHQGNRLLLRRLASELCLGARDYDPKTGRWTAKDPIFFYGGINFYVYASNDPVNRFDLFGRGDSRTLPFTDPFFDYEDASRSAEDKFGEPGGGHNGPGDAYRHCLASCWLTQQWGSYYAWFWGQLNEAVTIPQPPDDEVEMDRENNACGRDFGRESDSDCSMRCYSAAINGQLKTL